MGFKPVICFFYKAIVFSLHNIQNPVRKYKPVWYFTRRELIALGIEELKNQTEYGEAAQTESDTSKTWPKGSKEIVLRKWYYWSPGASQYKLGDLLACFLAAGTMEENLCNRSKSCSLDTNPNRRERENYPDSLQSSTSASH